ncbi:MAG: low-specificity L-threonine aldolase [Gammaproteobacteria bacterium]|nr:low-specificity L-threonine aldolase [Gammaproteobacteria bacterium]NIR81958.1 low-specificity L-threonine aldolase [Gammaproteobacteria bacterium]NIR89010.1 low-specificity L-threonine aldolase [Gammaproteobacteria bacterium]NIU03065.1 low-specificity L-threonine aldolase [Gammaproteobacteria bacterium]NIV50589.1 low-specificity L-threonine aldolase [Gammaproteobacteria bacterium]
MKTIDLRSDTVTRPTAAMRKAMAEAEVGDDVYGEDPTVNRLQVMAAERLGKEAALLVPSGTQANLVALLTHCQRGDEFLVGEEAHTYRLEGGSAAVLGGIQPQPLAMERDGTIELARIEAAIKPKDDHYPRTRLLWLENTLNGKVLPLDYLPRARALASRHGLSSHLDGARVFNAAVKLGVPVTAIAVHFDSVSFCLSKGLGAPVGSLLCGPRDFVERARRWRKVAGGGMRQAGVLAAAGIVALESHVERLSEDHANAAMLAEGLAEVEEMQVDPAAVQTNMVFAYPGPDRGEALLRYLKERGIVVNQRHPIRFVTHLDVGAEDVRTTIGAVREFFARRTAA